MVMWWCGIGLIAVGGVLFWLGQRLARRPARGATGDPVTGTALRIGGGALFLVGVALLFLGNTLAS